MTWDDAALDCSFDGPLGDLPPAGLARNRTVGFLLSETRKEIRLAVDVTDLDNTVRWIYTIPRGWIRSKVFLQEKPNGPGPIDP